MERVILKRPFWDGRVLHPRGPAYLPGPFPAGATHEDGTPVARVERAVAVPVAPQALPVKAEPKK